MGRAARAIRLTEGKSQAEVADAAGLSQACVSRFERGKSDWPASRLRALCAALGVRPWILLAGAEPVENHAEAEDLALIADVARLAAADPECHRVVAEVVAAAKEGGRAWEVIQFLLAKPTRDTVGGLVALSLVLSGAEYGIAAELTS